MGLSYSLKWGVKWQWVWDATAVRMITMISMIATIQQAFLLRSSRQGRKMLDVGIVMVEVEFVMQWTSAGSIFDPILTLLVSKSIFDLINLRKLSPRMRRCANDDTTIADLGHILLSETISTWTVPSVVKVSPVAPTRW